MFLPPHFLGHTFSWYWLLLSVAIIISLAVFFVLERRRPSGGILWQKLSIVYGTIIVGFIFGRIVSMAEHYIGLGYLPPVKELLSQFKTWEASRWYGALTAGFLFLELIRVIFRKVKINWSQYFSNIAIAVCLGIAIGKIGCFLDGHIGCGGMATDLPWGVYYPYGTAASDIPLHPVQIYDFIAYTSVFLVLLYYHRKGNADLYRLFFLAVSLYNIPIEFVISNNVFLTGHLSFGQYVYTFLGIVAAIPLIRKSYRKRYVSLG
jgi:prolipoprotein diacylglyceryltransferase